MHNTAIAAEQLTIIRDGQTVLDRLSFTIKKGNITGLIGPSGSGKTTLMRAIVGTQVITGGTLTVLDQPAGDASLRSRIGYVSQTPAVYDDLTVRENLHYFAAVLGQSTARVNDVLDIVDLGLMGDRLVGALSGGQRARVSLGVALLGDAELLILDEPTVGLDPLLRRRLWDLFARLSDQGKTLLISSHVMDEAEQCPRLLLMREGKILRHGSRDDILAGTGASDINEAFIRLIEAPADFPASAVQEGDSHAS